MKKVLMAAAALGLICPASLTRADAPLIYCIGTESGGAGPRRYAYNIDSASFPMMEFQAGTNDLEIADYTNVLIPPNWHFAVEPVRMGHIHGVKTPHGQVSPGPCRCLTRGRARWWTDDPVAAVESFVFGYDHPWSSEDVSWTLLTRREGPPPESYTLRENWDAPVGTGFGPVHGPSIVSGPATLTWDGTDPGHWTSAHWDPGPVAPGGGEAMVVNSGTVTVSSDLTATPADSLDIARGAADGTVSIGPAGELLVTGGVTVGAGGTLSIDGVLAAPVVIVSGGSLTSSSGPGTAFVDGSVILTEGGTLAVKATDAGIVRLICHDPVTIDPCASLDITVAGSPGPALGDTMPVIQATAGLNGVFGHVDGVLQPGNKAFAVTYGPYSATATVVTPGDFEVDGDVDFSDFTRLAACYGQATPADPATWSDGDADGDGDVDFSDFTHLAANYGSDTDAAAEAPSAGAVELHVDIVTGEMRLVGNAATLSGYSVTSVAGSLVPDGDVAAAPFQFYLANLTDDISAAGVGVGGLIEGELPLDAGYDTSEPMDLVFSYGVFGQGGPLSGDVIVVPEPTCVALLALGALAALRRRRRE